jgi:hypothetical protein
MQSLYLLRAFQWYQKQDKGHRGLGDLNVTYKTRGCVSHCGLAIYIKTDLKAKEELWKLKYFTIAKIHLIFQQKIL